jgi:hypothetical protein
MKGNHATVDKHIITYYIENVRTVTEGVPPENIFNFDETNLTGNPGQKKVIVRRGVKYPEKICNF